jgi:hypothetical protein
MSNHTLGPTAYSCKHCGWSGEVSGRPRCLPCCAKRTKEWRQQNPDKAADLKRRMEKQSRVNRPEVEAARKRRVRSRNPEHYRAKYAERLEWLRAGDVTRADLERIFAEANGKCVYCGTEVRARFTPSDPRGFDHVIPRSKCGLHTSSNLALACGDCNARRSDNG